MMKWKYVAMDSKGAEQTGTLEAATQQAALAHLRSLGLFPTKLMETPPETSPAPQHSSPLRSWDSSAPKRH
ncbi:MAG: hypothetical protein NTY53_15430 [Kiritimatiellaeota bacterium]|nr:hypothetical protein [Kiritimatiellota bacterium]